jgi:hypothetical protein
MDECADNKIKLLEDYLEWVHQNTDGSCPVCQQPDYPVSGDKEGCDEVSSEDAEEYHCDHDEECAVSVIEKFITACNTRPTPETSKAVSNAKAYLKATSSRVRMGDEPISMGHIVALIKCDNDQSDMIEALCGDIELLKQQLTEKSEVCTVLCDTNAHLNEQLDKKDGMIELLKQQKEDLGRENQTLKDKDVSQSLCISDLSFGVAKLWDSITSHMHDARSLVGDTTLDMQQSLMNYLKIDARGIKILKEREID